jgi:hypothetical protein
MEMASSARSPVSPMVGLVYRLDKLPDTIARGKGDKQHFQLKGYSIFIFKCHSKTYICLCFGNVKTSVPVKGADHPASQSNLA